ncbi:MAG: hypothetical protein V1721_03610 [Pseudomonadota bacterium]
MNLHLKESIGTIKESIGTMKGKAMRAFNTVAPILVPLAVPLAVIALTAAAALLSGCIDQPDNVVNNVDAIVNNASSVANSTLHIDPVTTTVTSAPVAVASSTGNPLLDNIMDACGKGVDSVVVTGPKGPITLPIDSSMKVSDCTTKALGELSKLSR